MLPDLNAVTLATFKILEGASAGSPAFAVQFNPASLELNLTNEFDRTAGNNATRQFVKKTSGKLAMTLIFDTTDTGGDVRAVTANIAALLQPAKSGAKKFAPKVEFSWGSYSFKGVVELYKETIDFFSASGVPLRASINLTLASQEVEFQSSKNPAPAVDRQPPEAVAVPSGIAPKDIANALGDPRAARAIASATATASLRFGAEAGLSVGGEVMLAAAAGFSADAGVGAGMNNQATAGIAFTGLRRAPPALPVNNGDARAALLPAPAGAGATAFGPGGRARVQTGASLSADVGANARIGFGA